jgi:hypothetical protein
MQANCICQKDSPIQVEKATGPSGGMRRIFKVVAKIMDGGAMPFARVPFAWKRSIFVFANGKR